MAAAGIMMGGNVRVGFEDNIYLERGRKAKSNAELVEKVVALAKLLGREAGQPDEAARVLGHEKVSAIFPSHRHPNNILNLFFIKE